jgi:hypothetical protein
LVARSSRSPRLRGRANVRLAHPAFSVLGALAPPVARPVLAVELSFQSEMT